MSRVSIVIPTFGNSPFLLDAIKSVINQDYSDIEIIVVDDNGVGTSCQKENERALDCYIKAKKVQYIVHKTNKGGSAARNTGIKISSGDYIAFLDDDDLFLPTKISSQITQMVEEKTGACICNFQRFYTNGYVVESNINPEIINSVSILQLRVDTCSGSSLIVDRDVALKIGGFDETFIRMQDIEFIYRVSKVTKISLSKDMLLRVRMHSNLSNQIVAGEKYELYVTHFMETFKKDIDSLPLQDRIAAYDTFFYSISKSYLKNHNILPAIKWISKMKQKTKYLSKFFSDWNKYMKERKNRGN